MQMGDRSVTLFVTAFNFGYIMAGSFITMSGIGIAVWIVYLNIAIRLHVYFRAAVAEIPDLLAVRGAERTHLEGDCVAGLDVEGRVIGRMDGGW